MNKPFLILLVDDDEDDRDVFCDMVEEIDPTLSCTTAIDGLDALELLNKTSPDLIFLDMNMPRLNGKQMMFKIKSNPLWNNIPVVIYSTSRLAKDISEMTDAGAIDFISKPPEAKDLKNAISTIISRVLVNKKILLT